MFGVIEQLGFHENIWISRYTSLRGRLSVVSQTTSCCATRVKVQIYVDPRVIT